MEKIKEYYELTKPGIVYGNALTVIAGFLLASRGHVNLWLLVATVLGISLVIASACVFNNYIDRDIDKKMSRTKKRALALGVISGSAALVYGTILGVFGFGILALYTNALTVWIGLFAMAMYVVVYGIAKRRSPFGTVVGSVSGALPPVIGYAAVTNTLDLGALLLFLILMVWQMPHFYAIAIYRHKEYAAAGIPVLPVKKGMRTAKRQIIAYIVGFIVVAMLLNIFHYTGIMYAIVMLALGGVWLVKGLKGLHHNDDVAWARGMFFFSLIVLTVFCVLLSVDVFLP
jgi:protoheme IX farnesyltransferase